jgi:hypothetical protein
MQPGTSTCKLICSKARVARPGFPDSESPASRHVQHTVPYTGSLNMLFFRRASSRSGACRVQQPSGSFEIPPRLAASPGVSRWALAMTLAAVTCTVSARGNACPYSTPFLSSSFVSLTHTFSLTPLLRGSLSYFRSVPPHSYFLFSRSPFAFPIHSQIPAPISKYSTKLCHCILLRLFNTSPLLLAAVAGYPSPP